MHDNLAIGSIRSQSAMEYLMTYGWAILIIAVVLSVLFQLGIFSSGNFQPHAQAGACQVSRTVAGVSLEGQCGGLLPQFTGVFSGAEYASVPYSSVFPAGSSVGSQFGWVYLTAYPGAGAWSGAFGYGATSNYQGRFLSVNPSGTIVFVGYGDDYYSPYTLPLNQWHFVGYTYSGGTSATVCFDSACSSGALSGGTALSTPTNPVYIGEWGSGSSFWKGNIANVQLYNITLSSSEIQALYLEGIGGAPIRPQNLVGWWPLNGNANDYSGNSNNGQLNGVTFSSSWESSYTAP